MTTKTIKTIALLSTITACDNTLPFDPDSFDATWQSTFAEATDSQIGDAFYVGTGQDLRLAMLWGTPTFLEANMHLDASCATVTAVEGGVQYAFNGTSSCNFPIDGKVTMYGDVEDGGEGMFVWDNLEMGTPNYDTRSGSYTVNGTLSVGPGYLEADLVHATPMWEIENHARFEVEGNVEAGTDGYADAHLVHVPGSWASIAGLGAFDLSGTIDGVSMETDLAFTGTDTLTIYIAPDVSCWNIEVDGEPVEIEAVDRETCET